MRHALPQGWQRVCGIACNRDSRGCVVQCVARAIEALTDSSSAAVPLPQMVCESDVESEDESEDHHQQQQQQRRQPGQGAAAEACPAGGQDMPSCDENDAAAPNGSKAAGSGRRGGSGSSKQQRQRQEGVRVAGVTLLAFCPKHCQVAEKPAAASSQPLAPLGQQLPGAPAGAVAAGDSIGSLAAACCSTAAQPPQQSAEQQQLNTVAASAAVTAGAELSLVPQTLRAGHSWGSARAVPFNHAARRGQRAPEAWAAAEAKRAFVRSLPYLVGGQQGAGGRLTEVPPSRRSDPTPGVRGECQLAEAEVDADMVDAVAAEEEAVQRQQAQAASPPPAAGLQQQQQRAAPPLPALALPNAAAAPAWGQPGSPAAGQARLLVSPRAAVKSDGVKFREMVVSLGQRVTIGKSAIHGWGAFAKQRHAARE